MSGSAKVSDGDVRTPRDTENVEDEALNASAEAVFRTLNPDGKSELKFDEVLERIKTAEGDGGGNKVEYVAKVVRKLMRDKAGGELSENDMKKLNKRFMEGHLPRLKQKNRPREEHQADSEDELQLEKPGRIQNRILRHAALTTRSIWRYAEKFVSRSGRVWMWRLLPTGQINMLVSFLLFSYVIRASFLAWFVPLATLFVAICVMVISTIRIVRSMKRFAEFKAWAEFLDTISVTEEKTIDTGKAEENYLLNHISPHVHFLIATACCVMGYGTSDKSWVVNAELAILAMVMYSTVVYVFGFHKYGDTRSLFACQIMASVMRALRCIGHESFGFGYLTSVELPFFGASLNLSLASVLRVVTACKVASMFWKFPRHVKIGAHLVKYVLPLVVALVWWDVADMFFLESSIAGVVWASVELFSLLFAMQVFVLFLGYTLLKFTFSIELTKLSVTIVAVAAATVYFIVWKQRKEFLGSFKNFLECAPLKNAILAIGAVALGYAMLFYRPCGIRVAKSGLSWQDYKHICLENGQLSAVGNNVGNYVLCNEFKGYSVTWEGAVERIDVVSVENKVEDLLNLLPQHPALWLSCVYGEPYPSPEDCSKMESLPQLSKALCAAVAVVKRPCHILRSNLYTFKVTVSMPDGEDPHFISLHVSHDFFDSVMSMEKGMHLRFTGNVVGKGEISAKVLYVPSQDDKVRSAVKKRMRIEKTVDNMLDQAVDALYDFVLYPIVSFDEGGAVEK